ncbi:MAG TPA: amidase [Stellaceae bacterium]|nr:amidase [Stellaceae bacterium]
MADDLTRLTALDAAQRIAKGNLTAEALVRACLDRIGEREPVVQAWQHLDPEQAIAAARARDKEPARGPLHGVPIGVKDIMDTADMPTTYGSRAYAGFRPRADAACVALARAAGAIVLGKTVTTEFAAAAPGKTRNPHNPAHTPGGSSSGSAAGVAERMMPLAFGTQTAGSIIRPASYCGVVGYKPSYGTVALSGTKALAESFDTVGGFARTVSDVALFVSALSGRSNLVPTAPYPKPRIGLFRTAQWDRAEPACQATLERAARQLESLGALVKDRPSFPAYDRLPDIHLTHMNYEMARNLAWERSERWDLLAPRTTETLREAAHIDADTYDEMRRAAAAARERMDELFGDFDALLVPAAPGEAPARLDMTGDPLFNRVWTLLRVPCVTVPAGRGPAGLPIGVQLVGRPGDDVRTLAIARFAEQALEPIA